MLDDGQVRLVNTAAARLLQTTAAQAEGQSAMAVLRDHELASLTDEVMRGAATTSGPQLVELGPTAQRRTVQAMAARIPRADGSGERVLLMLQDVTELRRAETVRREFVSNVSHELRTPVASLKALVETLEGGALDERDVAREFLGRMQVEVDGLAQLVEELLELSQIEAGRLPLHLQSVDLGSVAAAAAGRLRPQAERQGVSLHVKPPVVLPAVEADPERIHQVVINLVHNAVKFTPPGGQVTVSGSQYDGGVAITVADTGMGIAPEVLPRLFERFYKADQARAGGGTGLGLAIAKHLVQAHGGRIWAESAGEGQGATFTFTLPISHAR
jgi:two-component system phosphate regulon sensor histidine kinase PhoR